MQQQTSIPVHGNVLLGLSLDPVAQFGLAHPVNETQSFVVASVLALCVFGFVAPVQ